MSKYNKGDKFIIELDEQMGNLWRIKGFNALVFDDFGLDRLGQLVQGVDQFSYNKGAENAWELAQRIAKEPSCGGFTAEELIDIFGYVSCEYAIRRHSYSEAAAKVEAWENGKSELRVGDVVLTDEGHIGVVTDMSDNYVDGIRSNGVAFSSRKSDCTKTGRHIDIEAVLAQIK